MSGSDRPLVSLCMAAWNPRPDWLRQAVQSALDQRGCRIELVICDNGSDEPVASLLPQPTDERLRITRIAHAGASAAFFAAFRASRGDFIRFIAADDVIERDSTTRLLALARAGADDMIAYGSLLVCDEQLRPLGSSSGWFPGLPIVEYLRGRFDPIDFKPLGMISSRARGYAIRDCLLGRLRGELQSMLFPRPVVEATGEWLDLPVSEDWDFLLRVLEHAPVRGERAVATYYRRHGGQTTRRAFAGLESAEVVLDRHFERHPDQRGTRLERQARARLQLRWAGAYAFARHEPFAAQGRGTLFLQHLCRAAKLDPLATSGRVLAWSPWLLSRLARKLASRSHT